MAKKPHSDSGAHSEAPKEEAAKSADPRARIVDALLTLAGERTFEDITIRDVCAAANVRLADFRDLFVSKGAVLLHRNLVANVLHLDYAGLKRRMELGSSGQQPVAPEASAPQFVEMPVCRIALAASVDGV